MNRPRRNLKLKPEIESMDARVVPSALGFAQLAHARAVAAHQALVRARIAAAARAHSPFSFHGSFSPTISYSSMSHVTSSARSASLVRTSASRPATITTGAAITVSNSSQNQSTTPTRAATTTDVGDVKNGPLAKAGQDLIALVQGTLSSSRASLLYISGSSVKVDVRGTGNVAAFANQLTAQGMQVEHADARTGTVEGFVPINQLVNIAQMSQVTTISPVYRPARF